jgi:hypothetical protein
MEQLGGQLAEADREAIQTAVDDPQTALAV